MHVIYVKRAFKILFNLYYGSYSNENGETYLNGKNLPPVNFEKDYIYVPDGPGSIPEQMEKVRRALSERIASGQEPHTYTIYGNIGLVTSDALLECNNSEDVDELFNKLFTEQRNLKRIDRLLENGR